MILNGTLYLFIVFVLSLISIDDIQIRTVKHRYLLGLMVLILLLWLKSPNLAVLPYSFLILLAGIGLHSFKVLGAGDTKLLFVVSLGVSPDHLPLLLYGSAFFGFILILVYLIVGVLKGMEHVRREGLPFAVPISLSGMLSIFISNCI